MTFGSPADTEQEVRPEELFFSTTDRRGVIRNGNRVFERISGYSLPQLIGAPHNVVRHPRMPAGVFTLLWERILDGRPAGAYVRNRTRSGATYWVFATVTPLGSGFLSVRMAPLGPAVDAVKALYETVRDHELGLTEATRTEVGESGAAFIEHALADLGYPDYDAFMDDALAAEVSARAGLVDTAFARPGAAGSLGRILDRAHVLDAELQQLTARLDYYGELASAVTTAAGQVISDARRLELAVDTARQVSQDVGAHVGALRNVAAVMGGPMASAVAGLEDLSPALRRLGAEVNQQRFRTALTRLHLQMVAAFAAEGVDGLAPSGALAEVPLLCDALHDDVLDLTASTTAANKALEQVRGGVQDAEGLLREFRVFLGQWRILVMRHRLAAAAAETIGPIDAQLDASHDQLDHLAGLAQACRDAVVRLDVDAVDAVLSSIRSSADNAA